MPFMHILDHLYTEYKRAGVAFGAEPETFIKWAKEYLNEYPVSSCDLHSSPAFVVLLRDGVNVVISDAVEDSTSDMQPDTSIPVTQHNRDNRRSGQLEPSVYVSVHGTKNAYDR